MSFGVWSQTLTEQRPGLCPAGPPCALPLLSRHFTPSPYLGYTAHRSVLSCWLLPSHLFFLVCHLSPAASCPRAQVGPGAFSVGLCQLSSLGRGVQGIFLPEPAILHHEQGCNAHSPPTWEMKAANLTPIKAQKWSSSPFKSALGERGNTNECCCHFSWA